MMALAAAAVLAAAHIAPTTDARPFPALPRAFAAARAALGRPCGWRDGEMGADVAGFAPVRGALPVTTRDGSVVARQRDGVRFAFLVRVTADELTGRCTVMDVAVLPQAPAALLQCTVILDPRGTPGGANWISGFGVRRPGQRQPLALWTLRPDGRHLERISPGRLGLKAEVRCHEPEVGD